MLLHREMNILVSSLAQTHAIWQSGLVTSRSTTAVQSGFLVSQISGHSCAHIHLSFKKTVNKKVPLSLLQLHSKEDADIGLPMTCISDAMVEFLESLLVLVLSRWTSWRTHNIQYQL